MNVAKRLRHLADKSASPRQMGKTSLIAKSAKELNGVLLAHDFHLAKILEKKYDVVTRCVFQNLDGFMGPFFFDHLAVETLFLQAASKIEKLEQEQEIANMQLATLDKKLLEANSKIESLEKDLCDTTNLLNKVNAAIIRASVEVLGMS